jgi:hypothetical protein
VSVVVLPGPALDPLEAAARLHGLPGRFLLHSASDADGVGRWSFVGAEPAEVLGDFAGIDATLARCEAVAAVAGREPQPLLVGFLSYDLWRQLEAGSVRAGGARADSGVPDVWLGAYHAVWRHDGVKAEIVGEAQTPTGWPSGWRGRPWLRNPRCSARSSTTSRRAGTSPPSRARSSTSRPATCTRSTWPAG